MKHFTILFILTKMILLQATKKDLKNIFKISIFYDDTYDNIEDLASYSIEANNHVAKKSNYQFDYSISRITNSETFKLSRQACREVSLGRIAFVTIGNSKSFEFVKLIAHSLNIPYISIKPNTNVVSNINRYELNIHPPVSKMMESLVDMLNHYKWTFITVLYQEPSRIEDIIRYSNENLDNRLRFQFKKLDDNENEWSVVLKETKASGSFHLIIDLDTRLMNKFLQIADEAGITSFYYHLLFTTLDLSIITNVTGFKLSANITALQVFEPNNLKINALFAGINLKRNSMKKTLLKYVPSIAIFIYDAFLLLSHTINKHNLTDLMQIPNTVTCQSEIPWSFGAKFKKFLADSSFNGLSGHIQFDKSGLRNNLTLSIVDNIKNSIDLIGFWRDKPTDNKTIEIVRSYEKEKDQIYYRLNRNLIVTTKIEEPYVMYKKDALNLTGNARFEGYCIDLLEKISSICNFTYTIKLVDDGFHGTLVNGKWNGIIGELVDKKADLAVAALTITSLREQFIDFSEPFLNLGISILYKRPPKKKNQLFSFLSPLEITIWIYVFIAYFVVSWVLYIIARFSPYEWKKIKTDGEVILQNQFTLRNSFWYCLGGLMKQGTDITPKSTSTKLIGCIWNFFTLILISSYTANLAAFITVQRMNTPLENAEALSRQTEIKYGPVKGGSTENFFKESRVPTYQRMWAFMSQNPDVFVKSSVEGVAKVKKGGFAYLLESTTNEYVRERDCELIQIGGLLDNKGYGLGTPTGSPWTNIISNAILKMQTYGDLQEFYMKWWKSDTKCPLIDEKPSSTTELSIGQIGGIFIVVLFGLVLSLIVVTLEFSWKAKKTSNSIGEFFHKFGQGFRKVIKNFTAKKFQNVFFIAPKQPIIMKYIQKDEQKIPVQIASRNFHQMNYFTTTNDLRMRKHNMNKFKKQQNKIKQNSSLLHQSQRLFSANEYTTII